MGGAALQVGPLGLHGPPFPVERDGALREGLLDPVPVHLCLKAAEGEWGTLACWLPLQVAGRALVGSKGLANWVTSRSGEGRGRPIGQKPSGREHEMPGLKGK